MKSIRLLFAVACLLGCAGCTSFTIEGDGTKGKHGVGTVHGSFYGFDWVQWEPSKCSDDIGLYRVDCHSNMLYSLAAVGTLGLYVPQDVEWWIQEKQQSTNAPVWNPNTPILKPKK